MMMTTMMITPFGQLGLWAPSLGVETFSHKSRLYCLKKGSYSDISVRYNTCILWWRDPVETAQKKQMEETQTRKKHKDSRCKTKGFYNTIVRQIRVCFFVNFLLNLPVAKSTNSPPPNMEATRTFSLFSRTQTNRSRCRPNPPPSTPSTMR